MRRIRTGGKTFKVWGMRNACLWIWFLSLPFAVRAQYGSFSERPKLFVQIVVGQLSPDQILKAKNEFDGIGIRTMIAEGTYCAQASYSHPYIRSSSSLATLVTGANPAIHGITGDTYYDRKLRRVESLSAIKVPALSDELRRISPASKVISVGFSQQTSVLLGGKHPSAAYWFDENSQKFVCRRNGASTISMPEYLPEWAKKMNEKSFAELYRDREWQSFYPKIRYANVQDNAPLVPFSEGRLLFGQTDKKKNGAPLFRETPYADNLIKDFAVAAIEGEGLGQDGYTDMLMVHWDASRQVANRFGIDSPEVQDAYFRMDDNLGSFIQYLNQTIGKTNYLLCLTSDAGGLGADEWMIRDQAFQVFEPIKAHLLLNVYLSAQYGKGDWVMAIHDQQIYLDHDLIEKAGLNPTVVQEKAISLLLQMEGVSVAYAAPHVPFLASQMPFSGVLAQYMTPHTGDIFFFLEPGWRNSACINKVQSSYYAQMHVPLLFYGWKMKPQTLSDAIDMKDVVQTLSNLMDLPMPTGAQGRSITKLLE